LAIPIGMLMLALVCGAASLALTVFGVWPAALLVLLSALLAGYSFKKIRKNDAASDR